MSTTESAPTKSNISTKAKKVKTVQDCTVLAAAYLMLFILVSNFTATRGETIGLWWIFDLFLGFVLIASAAIVIVSLLKIVTVFAEAIIKDGKSADN